MGSKGRPRLAIPLQLLHIGAVLRENAEASTVSRPSVQVEHQMMAAGEPRNLLGSCDGSQVVDSQEISSLRRQHEANASMNPAHSAPRQLLELYPRQSYMYINVQHNGSFVLWAARWRRVYSRTGGTGDLGCPPTEAHASIPADHNQG